MTLFDTHAHYDDEAFDADRDAVLAAFDGLVIDPGCTLASSQAAVDLTARHSHVYAAVGIHPENCGDFRPEDLDAIRALAREDKVVAIGEIGLDFARADELRKAFRDRVTVAFGIGTYIANDTCEEPLNIVMKTTACNGMDVAKISDTPGKEMCKNADYVDYLTRCIRWRLEHDR